jgi:integrase
VKHRGQVRAVIYGKSGSYGMYRVSWRPAEGQRRLKAFRRYSDAKRFANELVRELAKGSQATLLTASQAADALAALQMLDGFFQKTGKRLSLMSTVSQFCDAGLKLGPRTLSEAVDGFLSTVALVKRVDLAQAVEKFIEGRTPKTQVRNGKRPQLSKGYHYNVSMWLREFARTFPGCAVCELSKDQLNTYMENHTDVGPKTRNERRNAVRMFLKWAVGEDYLPLANRLLEANGMVRELAEPEEIEFYMAQELEAILSIASQKAEFKALVPVVAMVALGGVRLQEAVKLTWEDVWHVDGHIEISVAKSKTRSRRLVTMGSALASWLEPHRDRSGLVWIQCLDKFHTDFKKLLKACETVESLKVTPKRNGLRHGFVSAHYALHSDEGLTAKEAGNSPDMVHKNYKGLLTRTQAEAWFAVTPPARPENLITLAATQDQ